MGMKCVGEFILWGNGLRHGGTHSAYFLRIIWIRKGRVENKSMDEHILVDGNVEKLSEI